MRLITCCSISDSPDVFGLLYNNRRRQITIFNIITE